MDGMKHLLLYNMDKVKTTQQKITSVNQTIYKQLRGYLDGAMKNYRERVNNGEAKKII